MMVEHQNATYLHTHTHIVRFINTGVCFHTNRRKLQVLSRYQELLLLFYCLVSGVFTSSNMLCPDQSGKSFNLYKTD